MDELTTIQLPKDLRNRVAALRKVAKVKMNLDSGISVTMSGVLAVAIDLLEKEWGLEN